MPISVAVPVRRITQDEFHAIDYRVMGVIFDVHNGLGNLCDEHIYRDEIAERCRTGGFAQVHTEVGIRVSFEDFAKRYSIDLLVEGSALYELKVADALAPAHRKQTLNYLLLAGLAHGKLVNMKPDSVDHEFVSTRLTPDRRYVFHVDESRWKDYDDDGQWLRTLMKRLVSEWGVFLEVELFYDAVKYFRGGEDRVIHKIELFHDGRSIGTQRAHLLNRPTAFKISAITGDTTIYEKHLRKFFRHTKLARIQWINFNHHNVEFTTIESNDFARWFESPVEWELARMNAKPIRVSLFTLLLLPLAGAVVAESTHDSGPSQPLQPVYFQQIKVRGFWKDQIKRLTERWIPHCVKQMEEGGQGQELLNLVRTAKILKGESAGQFTGTPWSDAYVYNTIEAMCLALAVEPEGDKELTEAHAFLRKKLDEWIPIVLAAQMEDGYIHSYHVVNKFDRYTNINAHEFYVQGYFLEAGVAHHRITDGKDRRLFDAARKCADHLCETFGPSPKRNWIHGHAGMGYALCRLARLVNEVEGAGEGDKYFELAKFLFDNRHTVEKHRSEYRQSHLPVPEQSEAVGHAVRATYFYTAIADLAILTGDKAYLKAVDRIWGSAVNRRMYVTGGVGSTGRGEAFAGDFELPNDSAYCESCAGCGLSFWADRMHRLHHHGQCIDVQERVLYNNILGAIELSGVNFFYQNPLGADRKRYSWHGCPCCVGNIPRALIAIKDLMYALNAEKDTLFINHFVASEGTIEDVAGTSLRAEQQTDYPWKGDVSIHLHPAAAAQFTLKIRIPNRGESDLYTPKPDLKDTFIIQVNDEPQAVDVVDGYVSLDRKWEPGDRVDVCLPMDIQRVHADERVNDDRGHVALQRGPLVYNIEDADHDGQSRSVVLKPDVALSAVWKEDLLGGVMAIESEDKSLFAIPNYVRQNREGWSQVWIPEKPELAAPRLEPTIASTSKVTTSYRTHEGRFSTRAIHDQKEPKQSDERHTPLFHWWPHLGTREWVQYDFKKPEKVGSVEVYWYDDRAWGNCRIPESWQLLYRDGDEWKPVRGVSDYGIELDKFNRVTFEPITTDALRLDVQLQKGQSAGVLEWRAK